MSDLEREERYDGWKRAVAAALTANTAGTPA
jgi:hypothetical protein